MNKTINIFEYKCKKGEENNTFGCMETCFFLLKHKLKCLFFHLYVYNFFFFSAPGHIATLFSSSGVIFGLRPPKVVGKVCLVTSSESGLSTLDLVCMP